MARAETHFIPAQMTKEEWLKVDKVPYRGEILVEMGGVVPRFKFGDGMQLYKDLPYSSAYVELKDNQWVVDGKPTGLLAGLTPEQLLAVKKLSNVSDTLDKYLEGTGVKRVAVVDHGSELGDIPNDTLIIELEGEEA